MNYQRGVLTFSLPALTRKPTISARGSASKSCIAAYFRWQIISVGDSKHGRFSQTITILLDISPDEGADNLAEMLGFLHEKTAKWINRPDGTSGREVWHNFWETRLTHKNSYLARLNYVHQNPVKHGVANQYPWCSAGWFERTARPAQVKTIYGFKIDSLKVLDDYDVC